MSGPLEGVHVVDCAHWIQGGNIGRMLGDLGAEIVKVEERVGGDQVRGWLQSGYGAQTQQVERNYMLDFANRSKRGITLNLRSDKGKEILYKLVSGADIFVHNWRDDGVSRRLGADYDTLFKINPRIIYAHATGWGSQGPFSGKPAFEPTAQARSGMLDLYTEPGGIPPIFPGGIGDLTGAITALVGILAALQARQRTGLGQKVEASLFGSLVAMESPFIYTYVLNGVEYPKRSRSTMGNPLWNHYRCADDKWISFAMLQPDRYWHNFCLAVGIEHLEHDDRFKNMEARARNRAELIGILDKVFATKTSKEWVKHFDELGVDLLYSQVQNISELVNDTQALANEYIVDFDHPSFGKIKIPGLPYKFSRTPARIERAAPEFGQHTEEVLLELGYTWDDIGQFKDEKVI